MSGSWQAERAAARRLPREDARAEVGEDVRDDVAVGGGPTEFKLNRSFAAAGSHVWNALPSYLQLDATVDISNLGRSRPLGIETICFRAP